MSKHESLYFLSGKRTPFGGYGGSLKDVHPTQLSVAASKASMAQAGVDPEWIDHVIFGNVLPSGEGSIYIPRHIGLYSGVPQSRGALGVNRLCGTGFQVIVEAWHQMLAGDTAMALVGGVENMSMSPYQIRNARWGLRMGNSEVVDLMMESLSDSFCNAPMAITAENLAVQYKISREDSDLFSLQSQQKTRAAQESGKFEDEICPWETKNKKGETVKLLKDEHPRPETTPDILAKLKPVFKKDGVVTAGNASGIVDGAAAMIVASESAVAKRNLRPIGRMISYGVAGVDPSIMGMGPVDASKIALEKAGLRLSDMDLIEVNEAFAPQALAVAKALEIDPARMNVNGGAIAIGHPLAASGTRISMHMLYELRRRKKKLGLVSACIGGGQGIALVVEALS